MLGKDVQGYHNDPLVHFSALQDGGAAPLVGLFVLLSPTLADQQAHFATMTS